MGKKLNIVLTVLLLASITDYLTSTRKQWVDQRIEEQINQYEKKDRQWTEENFEESISLEQILNAYQSTYRLISTPYYRSEKGSILDSPFYSTGGGILLNGGYLLTVKHVAHKEHPGSRHPFFKKARYIYTKFYLTISSNKSARPQKYELESVLISENLDYSLLRIKTENELPFYRSGLNLPSVIDLGVKSVAIGFPSDLGRNIRMGNVSQIESDLGEHYLTFKNSLITGDSGGPLFVINKNNIKLTAIAGNIEMIPGYDSSPSSEKSIEILSDSGGPIFAAKNGDMKLMAIAAETKMISDHNKYTSVSHPTNINYGLRISSIIKDMEGLLASGKLDRRATREMKNFLKLNKRI